MGSMARQRRTGPKPKPTPLAPKPTPPEPPPAPKIREAYQDGMLAAEPVSALPQLGVMLARQAGGLEVAAAPWWRATTDGDGCTYEFAAEKDGDALVVVRVGNDGSVEVP